MSHPTPQLKEAVVRQMLASVLSEAEPVAILACRGYYRDSMGVPGRNDVGIFDDAFFLVYPGGFKAVQANTDPSRLGWNKAVGKEFAMLLPGLWYFYMGAHKGRRPALRQATEEEAPEYGIPNHGKFKVWRAEDMQQVLDGKARVDENYHAINIHSGGDTTTSSWGCQTIPADTFEDFMLTVWREMKAAHQHRIGYLLVNGPLT